MAVAKKEAVTSIRTTLGRKDRYREAAESEGRRLSEWLRWLADRRLEELDRERAAA
jgi:hypothetical protein